ncbi:SCP2 sterol-binding domain-containing protein [Nocardiopsis sp. Huas11]|uniref:SCP2 sterol-binding domain-containing protein n=1 Tax=Nocardiopsis sp. Huas11 TaxID=2183912 RepID=UPI000EAEC551|nr:SCP2 sterol-binding domain-containing protein [Nocardiopsis sp. Huas11]
MSSIDACLAGIAKVNERILERPSQERRRHIRERSVSVRVPDLDTVFDMRLTQDGLVDVTHRPTDTAAPKAQVVVTVDSDDLVDLAEDRMDYAKALFSRRVRVEASVSDLLRMRKLI